jgi:hypothetical protein
MASSSSSASSLPPLGAKVTEKLTRENYILWKAQIMPANRGANLVPILTGVSKAPAETMEVTKDGKPMTVPNPEYEKWMVQDQQLLSYILNSLTSDVLAQVATLESSAPVWAALETMFSAQSRARITNLRMQLANCKKGGLTAAAYFSKMKKLGDELAAADKVIEDDEMVTLILTSLYFDYNLLVSSVVGRSTPISVSELYSQLLAFDSRLEPLQENNKSNYQSSANSASRGRGNNRGRGGNGGRGGHSGRGFPG